MRERTRAAYLEVEEEKKEERGKLQKLQKKQTKKWRGKCAKD